jgi:transcriptional regulator with XRE-family HTH domain
VKKIEVYRKRQRLTGAELARRAGISPSQVSNIELGRHIPPAGSITLVRLNKALGRPETRADALLEEVDHE